MKYEIEDVLDFLNEGRSIDPDDVNDLLDRKIWIAYHGWPGCLSEGYGYFLTKKDAIESLLEIFDYVSGIKTNLKKSNIFYRDGYRWAIDRIAVGDAIG